MEKPESCPTCNRYTTRGHEQFASECRAKPLSADRPNAAVEQANRRVALRYCRGSFKAERHRHGLHRLARPGEGR